MKYLAAGGLAAISICALVGCGGSNSPLLGTGNSPRIRILDISGGTLTAEYDNSGNAMGTYSNGQVGSYLTEGEGNNTVIFQNQGSTVANLNTVFQYGDYYTVVGYYQGGNFNAFSVVDNNIALNNGQSQIRAVNANTTATSAVDVYVQSGSTTSPTLTSANLISAGGGLSFGTATAYASEGPGQYTVTVTPTGNTSTILLNTTVTLNGGQSLTVYALTGSTSVTTTDDEGG